MHFANAAISTGAHCAPLQSTSPTHKKDSAGAESFSRGLVSGLATIATAAESVAAATEQHNQDYDNPKTAVAAKKAVITHSGILLKIFVPVSGSVHSIRLGGKGDGN